MSGLNLIKQYRICCSGRMGTQMAVKVNRMTGGLNKGVLSCGCVRVCACICACVRACVRASVSVSVGVSVYVYVCVCVCVCVCISVRLSLCLSVLPSIRPSVCDTVRAWVRGCKRACVHASMRSFVSSCVRACVRSACVRACVSHIAIMVKRTMKALSMGRTAVDNAHTSCRKARIRPNSRTTCGERRRRLVEEWRRNGERHESLGWACLAARARVMAPAHACARAE